MLGAKPSGVAARGDDTSGGNAARIDILSSANKKAPIDGFGLLKRQGQLEEVTLRFNDLRCPRVFGPPRVGSRQIRLLMR